MENKEKLKILKEPISTKILNNKREKKALEMYYTLRNGQEKIHLLNVLIGSEEMPGILLGKKYLGAKFEIYKSLCYDDGVVTNISETLKDGSFSIKHFRRACESLEEEGIVLIPKFGRICYIFFNPIWLKKVFGKKFFDVRNGKCK